MSNKIDRCAVRCSLCSGCSFAAGTGERNPAHHQRGPHTAATTEYKGRHLLSAWAVGYFRSFVSLFVVIESDNSPKNMEDQEATKKVEAGSPTAAEPPSQPKDVTVEKVAVTPPPPAEPKIDESKALVAIDNTPDSAEKKKISGGSFDRDVALAGFEKEKTLSFIKAWEDNEKSKAENKANKKLSAVASWENSKKAAMEANLRKLEEQLEKKKAAYGEQVKNKIALIHKEAEEKKAMVESMRGEELLKAEETAAKYRATGHIPKKFLGCFGG